MQNFTYEKELDLQENKDGEKTYFGTNGCAQEDSFWYGGNRKLRNGKL